MTQIITPTPLPIAIPTPPPAATAILGIFAPDDPLQPILFNIVRALVILLVALVLASATKRWIVRLLLRGKRLNANVASLVGNLAQIGIVLLGIINVLAAIGVELASLVAVLSVAGLAISLSLQDLLRNVVAGIFILLEQPFSIGDRITVKDVTGAVQGIELRTTHLRTDEGLQVVVPNNTMLTEIVTNRSASPQQRAGIKVSLETTDLEGLQEMAKDINQALTGIKEVAQSPAPTVIVEGVAEGTARLRAEFWFLTGQRAEVVSRAVAALRAKWPDADIAVE